MKMKVKRWVCLCLLLAGCGQTPPAEEAAQNIAARYGYHDFDKVEMVQYTFNFLVDNDTVQRIWRWNPGLNWFEYTNPGDSVKGGGTHLEVFRDSIRSADTLSLQADMRFINDNYWLFFPFHLMWDDNISLELDENVEMPVGQEIAHRLTVSYEDSGGYTPGDVYELYFNDDHLIQQWSFLRGGYAEYAFPATWESNQTAGPLLFSLVRQNPEENFRLWFSNVAVKMKDSGDWIFIE
ncbi:MAG: hypothetical protein WD077_06315 [Bacteroidia bacterium]